LLARVSGVAAVIAAPLLMGGCWHDRTAEVAEPLEVRRVLGEVGTSPGQFAYPRAMDFDGEHLWVVDKTGRVQRIDPETGRCLGGWKMPETLLGKPTGLTVAPGLEGEELVYVADTHYHRVVAYRPPPVPPGVTPSRDLIIDGEAEVAFAFGEYGDGPGRFIYPTDVAVVTDRSTGRAARVYVSEYGGSDRISVYEPDGAGSFKFVSSFGRFGSGSQAEPVEFNRPQSIAIDRASGRLVIADACNHRIGIFTAEGALVSWIGSPESAGDGPGRFRYPYGVFLVGESSGTSMGSVLVAEFGNNRVQRVDLDAGRCLGLFGGAGRLEGQLATPWAVTAGAGEVFVLDSQNNRIVAARVPGVRVASAEARGLKGSAVAAAGESRDRGEDR
jgi:DNA-binding beta-propeller fold protein YncE